jgi:hypothetical protein
VQFNNNQLKYYRKNWRGRRNRRKKQQANVKKKGRRQGRG